MLSRSRLASVAAALLLTASACATTPPPAQAGDGLFAWRVFAPPPEERAAVAASISAALEKAEHADVTACVSVRPRGEPDSLLLAAVEGDRPVVRARECPPTYDTGFGIAGRTLADRPAGYVDPYHVDVARQDYFLPDSAAFAIQVSQGPRTESYACASTRRDGSWTGSCRWTGSAIS